ncbi:NXPE family member 3-like [Synchiropus splendidus]|uniref:NXPE family member 3-like n=1 Tax=Synchiropus splendidus TaxID=270530 RepID=UPI00237D964B|nr:NXPE family member 3-like [Synchiropus splendidus]
MKEEEKSLGKSCVQKPMAVLILFSIFNAILLFQLWKTSKDQKYSHPPPKPNQQNNIGFVSQGQYNYKPTVEGDICKFQPSSPQELIEEQNIFSSIAWPQTPPLLGNKSTNARGSSFTLHRGAGGQQWHVGDELRVTITMKDFLGKPKKTGGDVLVARVHNSVLQAGVAGQVIDHENGSYTATFPLLWTGKATIEVTLLHPSEAVTVIRRLNKDNPDRVYFKSVFRLNSISETMNCNFCLRPTKLPVCDFTDLRTGEPWFCFKPKQLGCESRISHSMGGYHAKIFHDPGEEKVFQIGVNMKVKLRSEGPAFVNVLPQRNASSGSERNRTVENLGHSGYYYRGEWQALDGTRVQHFQKPAAMSKCLQGKKIYMFGDSTVRQWYEYLVEKLPGLVNFDFHNGPMTGPYMATDIANNIFMLYQVHGLPIRIRPISVSKLRVCDLLCCSQEQIAVTLKVAHFKLPVESSSFSLLESTIPFRCSVRWRMSEGGWTVFQRRSGNEVSFDRKWAAYKDGFGSLEENECVSTRRGGWWYSRCGSAELNGDWHELGNHLGWASGLHWDTWKAPYSLKATRMMVKAA